MKSIEKSIFEWARLTPNNPAVYNKNMVISYKELAEDIVAYSDILKNEFNIFHGDRVLLFAEKNIPTICIYFALHMIGAIAVPVAIETPSGKLVEVLNKTNGKYVIGSICSDEHLPFITLSNINKELSTVRELNDKDFPRGEDIADIMFTTGTTSGPKGILLSNRNISAAALNINTFIRNDSKDIELLALPISHSFGLARLRCVLSTGGSIVLLPSFANVKKLFRFLSDYNITGLAMVPSAWEYIKKMSGEKIGEFSGQLRYIEIGSSFMPESEKHYLSKILPSTRICMHYGLTEASRSAFIEFAENKSRLKSIGTSAPNVTISIRDETGAELSSNIEGEICIKGRNIFKGFLDSSLKLDNSFFGEYYRTGDLGYLDDQGFITLNGRKTEIINVGGKKVNPLEVESLIINIPEIADCACVGIQDKNMVMGEVVKVFLVKEKEEIPKQVIIDYLKDKLEPYKIPMEFEWITSIPKTNSGKVQRGRLKAVPEKYVGT
jgi:acyl-CoA synthetase (AMP-forming)/AMP-acid ligase II